jgi:hypothetical protein
MSSPSSKGATPDVASPTTDLVSFDPSPLTGVRTFSSNSGYKETD